MTTSETSQQRRSTTDQHQRVDVEQALLGGSTYKGVAEQELSEREERFELRRRTLGFFLAPWTTLSWVLCGPGGIEGFDVFLVGLAVLADLLTLVGSGGSYRRRG